MTHLSWTTRKRRFITILSTDGGSGLGVGVLPVSPYPEGDTSLPLPLPTFMAVTGNISR